MEREVIDFLFCFTTVLEYPTWGYAPFPYGAGIIKYEAGKPWMIPLLKHEFSHLFNCRHCTELSCIMNPITFPLLNAYDNWLPNCEAVMRAQIDYFTRHFLQINFAPTGFGTTDPPPGIYWHYHSSVVTVFSEPDTDYEIAKWIVDGAVYIGTYWSTGLLGLLESHELTPYFRIMPTLTVSVTGQGSVNPGSGHYKTGSTVTLTAFPSDGCMCFGWLFPPFDRRGPSDTLQVIMDDSKTVRAFFSLANSSDPVGGGSAGGC